MILIFVVSDKPCHIHLLYQYNMMSCPGTCILNFKFVIGNYIDVDVFDNIYSHSDKTNLF